MFRLAHLTLLGALLCLGSCSSSLTKLDMFVTASNSLNPDLGGRPSPIVVRLIELRHPAAFENTDFFALYQNPRQALAPDFVTQEEFELRPGSWRALKLHVQPGSRYVGVLAAYRDLQETRWRQVIPLEEQALHKVRLHLDDQGVRRLDTAEHEDD
ncbi:MAG TPA: type VI secretion system lipoprotein TssJ [Pseudomonas sp.]|nr:type VI secretion system lipoprotein TssJ [Pseudomonas sp.]